MITIASNPLMKIQNQDSKQNKTQIHFGNIELSITKTFKKAAPKIIKKTLKPKAEMDFLTELYGLANSKNFSSLSPIKENALFLNKLNGIEFSIKAPSEDVFIFSISNEIKKTYKVSKKDMNSFQKSLFNAILTHFLGVFAP